jgi:hypothetical protein
MEVIRRHDGRSSPEPQRERETVVGTRTFRCCSPRRSSGIFRVASYRNTPGERGSPVDRRGRSFVSSDTVCVIALSPGGRARPSRAVGSDHLWERDSAIPRVDPTVGSDPPTDDTRGFYRVVALSHTWCGTWPG